MRFFKLALRNLSRNRRRTLITLSAIGMGLAMMIGIINLQNGRYQSWLDAGVSTQAGHVVVQARGYQDERKATQIVEGAGEIAERLRSRYPDARVASRIFLGGVLNSPTGAARASLTGLEPEAERELQDLPEQIVEGEWLGSDDREIVLGCGMAESLGVGLGDKVVFLGQSGSEEVESRLFRVRGIFRTGAARLDGWVAYVHLPAAQELLGGGDVAHMVTLHLLDGDDAFEAAPRIADELDRPELDVLDWHQALPDVVAMIHIDRAACDWSLFFVALLVGFGVLNAILMSALERTREFGVLMAQGTSPRQVASLVLVEGLLMGVLGAGVGLVLGTLLSSYVIYYGLDYGAALGAETMEQGGVFVDTMFYGAWYPQRMITYSLTMVVFCVLAALYPAYTISRLRPVEALRHH